jgi:hypothetical protein
VKTHSAVFTGNVAENVTVVSLGVKPRFWSTTGRNDFHPGARRFTFFSVANTASAPSPPKPGRCHIRDTAGVTFDADITEYIANRVADGSG